MLCLTFLVVASAAKSLDGGRIVGGGEAREIVPYQASLRFADAHYGAGVVIAQRFVSFCFNPTKNFNSCD